MLLAFVLVLFTNTLTILLSLVAVVLASSYPFMKRYTHLPQVVLGAAFSWGIPMAFAAQTASCPRPCGCCTWATCCGPSPTTPSTPWSTATTTSRSASNPAPSCSADTTG